MSNTFKSESKLKEFLKILAEESINKVREDALIGEVEDEESDVEAEESDSEETSGKEGSEEEKETGIDDETAVKKEDDSEAVPHGEDITFYMLRDKLNVIRSGKSLKDSDVKDDLQEYVDKLEDVEKEALYIFLDSIGKIMIDEVSGEEAEDPSSEIEMQHNLENSHEDEDNEAEAQDKASTEDDSAPIRVGEPQIKEHVRKKIRNLMR